MTTVAVTEHDSRRKYILLMVCTTFFHEQDGEWVCFDLCSDRPIV